MTESRLSAIVGESFEAWYERYARGRMMNREHRDQARDGWLAREPQVRDGRRASLEWAAAWIEGSATEATRDFAANMAMTIRAEIGSARPEEKEMARLREIEHAAWHAIEACEERGDHLIIPLDEAVVLTKLLPEAHPGNDEAAPSPQKGRT